MATYRFAQFDDYNVSCQFDDIVKQNVDKVYRPKTTRLPIESHTRFGELNIPEDYINYLKLIKTTVMPNKNISSSGLAVALCEAFRDFTAGTHIKLSKNGDTVQDFESMELLNKAILSAELYGTSIIMTDYSKPTSEDDKQPHIILNATEFFYNETANVINYCFNTYYNGLDTMVSGYRYLNNRNELIIIEQYVSDGTRIGSVKYTVPNSESGVAGLQVYKFSHNPTSVGFYGQSAIHDIMSEIQTLELINHEYTKAMYYTKPRALINNEAVTLDENGEPNVDLTNDIYLEFDSYASDKNSIIETVSFQFNATAMSQILRDKLSSILTKVGLDSRILAFEGSKIERSATEITSNEDRMTATINHRRTEYVTQILEFINSIDNGLEVDFIPLRLLRFDSVVTNVVQLKSAGLISDELSIRMLHPYLSDSEITEELSRIKSERATTTDDVTNTVDEIDQVDPNSG